MACQDVREDAQAYLDNELSPARRALVEEHFNQCEACRKVFQELSAVSSVMSAWSEKKVSSRFDFALNMKLTDEAVPEATSEAAPIDIARRVSAPAPRGESAAAGAFRYAFSGWRLAAAAALVLAAFAVTLSVRLQSPDNAPLVARRMSGDLLAAIEAAGTAGQTADASIYAIVSSRRAIGADNLDSVRAVTSDVVYAFMAAVDDQVDQSAGKKLIRLLAGGEAVQPAAPPRIAALAEALSGLLGSPAYAAATINDPLAAGRRFEIQGRLREALSRYSTVTDPVDAGRAGIAEAAIRLRLGDLDGAQTGLERLTGHRDAIVRALASELLGEISMARKARQALATERPSGVTGNDWNRIGLMEVRAYDFRSAANSFMKAAGSAGVSQQFAREARFRSAWCQIEAGQISTGIYGFKSISAAQGPMSEIEYAAALEQAVGLARVGKAEESVAVCRELLRAPAPNRTLETLAHFHKGVVELRDLNDPKAAVASLGLASAAGKGNLSYAAQVLMESARR